MDSQPPTPTPSVPAGTLRQAGGWCVHEYGEVSSTNDLAAGLPAWHAVRAEAQTAGRGRHQRAWVSGRGGVWLSAVVPTGEASKGWAALPLAAGLAVCEAVSGYGPGPLRLRWPNDVMAGRRKLAGLLVDVFRPGLAVVGMGLNVTHRPGGVDPELAGTAVCLEELVEPVPPVVEVADRLLASLREVVGVMADGGFSALVPRVNAWWRTGMEVEIETGEGRTNGVFLGVDATGRLRVGNPGGRIQELAAHQVIRMRELPGD